ncbi:class I SAM-dependent DNA methyltransferase [Halalkalibacillus sediminis]|nr:class I SAM-dependent methyltransferase [Halalkalibacillus sediminis]
MAEVYDQLMSDAPYEEWVDFFNYFHQGINGDHKILDVGCGTGEIAIRLVNQGFNVSAFDLSNEMISRAKSKCPEGRIHFFQDDVRSLSLAEKFDTVYSFCDVVNYLNDKKDVKIAFQKIYDHLNEGGTFIFDAHSPSYIKKLLSDHIYSEVADEYSYVWFCEQGRSELEVIHDLTFFLQEKDGRYQRFDEVHTQRTFLQEEFKNFLNEVGFNKVSYYYDFSTVENNDDEASRIFFICQK